MNHAILLVIDCLLEVLSNFVRGQINKLRQGFQCLLLRRRKNRRPYSWQVWMRSKSKFWNLLWSVLQTLTWETSRVAPSSRPFLPDNTVLWLFKSSWLWQEKCPPQLAKLIFQTMLTRNSLKLALTKAQGSHLQSGATLGRSSCLALGASMMD